MKYYLIMGVAVAFGIAFLIILFQYIMLKRDLKKAKRPYCIPLNRMFQWGFLIIRVYRVKT